MPTEQDIADNNRIKRDVVREAFRSIEPIEPTEQELVEDLRRVQLKCKYTITRNYYRVHGKYNESAWHYYFPTFGNFLSAAGIAIEEEPIPFPNKTERTLNSFIDFSDSNVGDIFTIGVTSFRIYSKHGSAVYVKRYYWFNRLHDWLRSIVENNPKV